MTDRRELRAEQVTLASLFAVIGMIIWFAPLQVVVTSTNMDVFRIMPDVINIEGARALWGLSFLGCSFGFVALMQWRGFIALHIVGAMIGFANGTWLAAYTLPLIDGRGSLIGTIVFTTLLLWPGYVIYRVAHGAGESLVALGSGPTNTSTSSR